MSRSHCKFKQERFDAMWLGFCVPVENLSDFLLFVAFLSFTNSKRSSTVCQNANLTPVAYAGT